MQNKNGCFDHIYAYRVAKGGNYIVIESKNIKEVFLSRDSGTYVYKGLPGQPYPTYVKLLEKGAINLYERVIETGDLVGSKSTCWYLSRGEGVLVQIKFNGASAFGVGTPEERIKAFIDIVSDCGYVAAELKYAAIEKNYEYDAIRDFIRMYNIKCPAK